MDNMITFACDRCRKKIDSKQELRFVVSVEVEAAMDFDEEDRPDRQCINELQELLESLDTVDCAEISDKAYQKKSYDLCEECCHCLLYTSPSPRDKRQSRMPSSA